MNKQTSTPMTEPEKQAQIRKEAFWTVLLFALCALWHIGFGFGLNGSSVTLLGLPLWWWLSTPGVFVVAVVGVLLLLKFVFVNFDLGNEEEDA